MELAYIGIGCTDMAAMDKYLADVVGLQRGAPTPGGAATWRNDARAQRVIVQPAQKDDAQVLGFEFADAAELDAAVQRLGAAGHRCTPGSAADCAERRVQRLVRTQAPWGVDVELCLGLAKADTPFASAAFPAGFVTEGQGFGHAVFGLGDPAVYEAARAFATALGLKLSDWLDMPLGPPGSGAPNMHVSFLHCNARHHSLAIACVPMPPPPPGAKLPPALHHINFEVRDVGTVGAAYERALTSRTAIANTIGQHDNDAMISFYAHSPGGWLVEIGATGRTIGADWNDVRAYDRISRWGHQPPGVVAELQAAFLSTSSPVPTGAATPEPA